MANMTMVKNRLWGRLCHGGTVAGPPQRVGVFSRIKGVYSAESTNEKTHGKSPKKQSWAMSAVLLETRNFDWRAGCSCTNRPSLHFQTALPLNYMEGDGEQV